MVVLLHDDGLVAQKLLRDGRGEQVLDRGKLFEKVVEEFPTVLDLLVILSALNHESNYDINFLLGDGRDVEAGPPLAQTLAEVEEIIISASYFESAQVIIATNKISHKILGGVELRFGHLDVDCLV